MVEFKSRKFIMVGNKKNKSYYVCVPKFFFNEGILERVGEYRVSITRKEAEEMIKND